MRMSFPRTLVPMIALFTAGPLLAQDDAATALSAEEEGFIERPRLISPNAGNIGAGLQVGAPTAFTVKGMVNQNIGIDAGLGGLAPWLVGPTFTVHGDVHWHPLALIQTEVLSLSPYVGAGAQVGFAPLEVIPNMLLDVSDPEDRHPLLGYDYFPYDNYGLSAALRLPVGLSLAFHPFPLELFGELIPSMLVFPAVGGGLGATAGLRLWI